MKTYRDISTRTLEDFRERLLLINWSEITALTDVNNAYDKFLQIFKQCYYASFPVKAYHGCKRARKPLVTRDLLKLINVRNRMFEAFLKTRNNETLQEFKCFRNKLNKAISKAKEEYFITIFDNDCLLKSDVVWKKINNLLNRKPVSDAVDCMVVDNVLLSGKTLSNSFNDFFVQIGNTDTSPVTSVDVPRLSRFFFFQPTSVSEVITLFSAFGTVIAPMQMD